MNWESVDVQEEKLVQDMSYSVLHDRMSKILELKNLDDYEKEIQKDYRIALKAVREAENDDIDMYFSSATNPLKSA